MIEPSPAGNASPAAALAVLFAWADAISQAPLDDLLALYTDDALLVPTLSDRLCRSAEDRRSYFRESLANGGLACTMQIGDTRLSADGTHLAVTGLYDFVVPPEGRPLAARFLFDLEQTRDGWRIAAHHSSARP